MPGRDYVRELWPELIALEEHLDAMTRRSYEVKTKEDKNRGDVHTLDGQQLIDAIREYERVNGTQWRS